MEDCPSLDIYVEGIDIMQISGHTNVAFINNYSTLSEERHKKISNILSNTETNRNALVPVQFSTCLCPDICIISIPSTLFSLNFWTG
jgi:hypothetical protein